MENKAEKLKQFERLLDIMDELRAKCPWDKEQTLESLRVLTIEETYELSDAIIKNDYANISKELGDILLHIVFYAKIGEEQQSFNIANVIDGLCNKLIYRHPHVFGEQNIQTSKEVEQNWEQLKLKEKDGNKSTLSGIPTSMPSIIKAHRIQDKARGVGFDWDAKEDVWDKVEEELNELKQEIVSGNKKEMEQEFGDLFFSLINAARLYQINPDNALEYTNRKFMFRFNYIEQEAKKKEKSLKDMTLAEMEVLWNQAKKIEKLEQLV